MPIFLKSNFELLPFLFPLYLPIKFALIKNNKRGNKKQIPQKLFIPFYFFTFRFYFFLLSTRYATAKSPAIANTASKPGGVGVGVGVAVGVGVGVGGIVGVAVGVTAGVGVGVGVGVTGGFNAKHAAHSGFGSHGSSGSVP